MILTELRLQQGGTDEPREELRLVHNTCYDSDVMLEFATYANQAEEKIYSFMLSKSDAMLIITHLQISFEL